MQNADNEASNSQSTKPEQDEEAAAAAASSAAATADEGDQQPELEEKLDEEVPQSKIKTRSRFSAAFRSLSKSKSKKTKELPQATRTRSEEQLALISGAEEDQSIDCAGGGVPKKKRSLTRRLLLGGLKSKAKVRPHSLAASDEISLRSSSSRERTATATPTNSGSNTLQITISGKKVEPLPVKGKAAKSSKSKSHNSETDYLTPTPPTTPTTTTPAAAITATATAIATAATGKSTSTTTTLTTTISKEDTTTSSSSSRRTTKLIVAKLAKEPSKKPKQKQPKTQPEPEKIVITESKRDTPPRERAPAKPSRANANQLASSSGAVRKSSNTSTTNTTTTTATSSSSSSVPNRKERDLLQQQQQRGHRLKHRSLSNSRNTGTTAAPASPLPALETPPAYPPPPPPPPPATAAETSTRVIVSLSDVEEQTDAVSLAESAGTQAVVRFEVGSAVRGPAADADAYEAALLAAATQQPSSSEETSDSSLRRHTFAQQPKVALSDHDSLEGRRETLHYQSVRSRDSNEIDSNSEKDVGEAKPMPAFGDLTMEQEMEPTIMAPTSEKREHLYKILVIGELGTGKTSFIKRYVHQFFSQNYRATIGVDFALKVLHWDTNTIVRLQLWDIAGQERFGNMTRVYYKEAVGAFIVFDVTRSGTFDCVSKWKEDLDSKVQLPDGSPIPCILLANKCDQEKQGIVTQPERMDEYVRENGFAGWFETSAKENINIDEAARALVNKILINDKLITADANDAEKFNLSSAADTSADSKSKCSC